MKGNLYCQHGNWLNVDVNFQSFINNLEKLLDKELTAHSVYRCPICNEATGGAKNSAHLRGQAADVACVDNGERADLIAALVRLRQDNFRIGIGKNYIHFDIGNEIDGYAQKRIWVY